MCNPNPNPNATTAADLLPTDLLDPILLLTHSPLPIAATCTSLSTLALAPCRPLRVAWLQRAISANKRFVFTTKAALDDSFGFFNRYLLRNPHVLAHNPLPADLVLWLLHAPRWFALPPAPRWVPILSHLLRAPDASAAQMCTSGRAVANLVLVLRVPLMYLHAGRIDDLERVLGALCQVCPNLVRRASAEIGDSWCPGHVLDFGLVWALSVWSRPTYVAWLQAVAESSTIDGNGEDSELERVRNVIQALVSDACK